MKSNQNQVSREASLPHKAFALQTEQNQCCNYFALLRTLQSRFSKTCYALASAQPSIVLSGFARSLSADGKGKEIISISFW